MEYRKFLLPVAGLCLFLGLSQDAYGQNSRNSQKEYVIIVPGKRGVTIINQNPNGSTSRHIEYPRLPNVRVYPTAPLQGSVIYKNKSRSVARQYDLRPSTLAKRAEQEIKSAIQRNRVITIRKKP